MRKTIDDVRTGRLSFLKAAAFYKILVGIWHRLTKKEGPVSSVVDTKLGRKSYLGDEIENKLVEYVLILERTFFRMTRDDLCRMAYQLAVKNKLKHPFSGETAGECKFNCLLSITSKIN